MPWRDESWLKSAMLSARRSRMLTNCPVCARWTSACGIGSAAGDRIMPRFDSDGRNEGLIGGRMLNGPWH